MSYTKLTKLEGVKASRSRKTRPKSPSGPVVCVDTCGAIDRAIATIKADCILHFEVFESVLLALALLWPLLACCLIDNERV